MSLVAEAKARLLFSSYSGLFERASPSLSVTRTVNSVTRSLPRTRPRTVNWPALVRFSAGTSSHSTAKSFVS